MFASIKVAIERPDLPRRLVVRSTLDFESVGDGLSLDVWGFFADGTRVGLEHSSYVRYTSDKPAVATVDDQGLVTSVGRGTASILVTYTVPSKGRLSAKAAVTVP